MCDAKRRFFRLFYIVINLICMFRLCWKWFHQNVKRWRNTFLSRTMEYIRHGGPVMHCLAWSLSRQVTMSRGGPDVPRAVPICNVAKRHAISVRTFLAYDERGKISIRAKWFALRTVAICLNTVQAVYATGNSGVYVLQVRHLKNRPLHYAAFARYRGT